MLGRTRWSRSAPRDARPAAQAWLGAALSVEFTGRRVSPDIRPGQSQLESRSLSKCSPWAQSQTGKGRMLARAAWAKSGESACLTDASSGKRRVATGYCDGDVRGERRKDRPRRTDHPARSESGRWLKTTASATNGTSAKQKT